MALTMGRSFATGAVASRRGGSSFGNRASAAAQMTDASAELSEAGAFNQFSRSCVFCCPSTDRHPPGFVSRSNGLREGPRRPRGFARFICRRSSRPAGPLNSVWGASL